MPKFSFKSCFPTSRSRVDSTSYPSDYVLDRSDSNMSFLSKLRSKRRTTREKFYTCSEEDLTQQLQQNGIYMNKEITISDIKVEEEIKEVKCYCANISCVSKLKCKTLSELPSLDAWKGPCLLRIEDSSRNSGEKTLLKEPFATNINPHNLEYNNLERESVVNFETEIFKGKAVFRFKGCPNEPSAYFKGRRRRQQWTIQGEFKQPIKASQVVTGYEFKRPAINIPAKFMVKSALKIVRKLAPTMKEDVFGEQPYFLNPILQTVQVFDASIPGQEPYILDEFVENNSEFLAKKNLSKGCRKNYFASAKNGDKHMFVPGTTYTFDFYEDKFDVSVFKLTLPMMSFDVLKYLDGQPISLMAKVFDEDSPLNGKYIFNFELFHKEQLSCNI
eukprot:snap_masked-scaffold_32-processed-gene-3.7-mRNA-1 protein AED:0.14 eAED:1.00 QI:0/0/0/1/1/1/2/0/387